MGAVVKVCLLVIALSRFVQTSAKSDTFPTSTCPVHTTVFFKLIWGTNASCWAVKPQLNTDVFILDSCYTVARLLKNPPGGAAGKTANSQRLCYEFEAPGTSQGEPVVI